MGFVAPSTPESLVTAIPISRFMASMSAPYFRRCSSYLLTRANSSASGNLFLRFCRGEIGAKAHSIWALVQFEHGSVLSHLILRLWHRMQGCLWFSVCLEAAVELVGPLVCIVKADANILGYQTDLILGVSQPAPGGPMEPSS